MASVHVQTLLLFLCLHLAESRWRAVARPKVEPPKALPHQLTQEQLNQLKLPNNVFCAQMEKQTAGLFILMPWWYHYCQDLKEKRARNLLTGNPFYRPIYGAAVEHVQWLRKHRRTPARRFNVNWLMRRL